MAYLTFPAHLNTVTEAICRDMEQGFASQLEARLQFMKLRGMTDPYELVLEQQQWIDQHQSKSQELLDKYLEVVPDYLKARDYSDNEFVQGWALMGGIWNSVLFEQIQPIVRLQRQYPALLEVANILGRIADPEGPERVPVSTGGQQQMHHATPSDIDGVGIGNNLNALLPHEMAQMTDPDLDGLFAYKYATNRLQTFSYKSNLLQPIHKLSIKKARQKGPMVVCLDTSASMSGVPLQIGYSLLVKLLQLALKQERELLLIAFAETAKPIDVKAQRTQLLQLFRKPADGGTEPKAMLERTLQTLTGNPSYGGADVLLISDFQIPMADASQLRQITELREMGTKFFGLQIGETQESNWPDYFDRIWKLPYKTRMKPWFIQK